MSRENPVLREVKAARKPGAGFLFGGETAAWRELRKISRGAPSPHCGLLSTGGEGPLSSNLPWQKDILTHRALGGVLSSGAK